MSLSRRSLLKASAIGGLFASSAATASPTDSPTKWDKEFDMVILGAGGGGLIAAHYAAELGLQPVVVEKLSFPGGSSAICGGALSVAGTEAQKAAGINDDDARFKADMMKVGKNINDPALVDAHIENIKPVYDFIVNTLGAKPKAVGSGSGMSLPRAHSYYPPSNLINQIFKHVTEVQKVPVLFNSAAERLVWENGRIAGVRVKQKDGTIFIKARKGVLIATGGFQFNKRLMKKYNPVMAKVVPAGGAGNTGDGMLMAQAYGADTLDTEFIKATFGYQLGNYPNSAHIYYSGAVIVNHAGKRFVDESISYKLLSDAALTQPDDFTFQFFDEKVRQQRIKDSPRNAMVLNVKELNEGKDTPYCFVGNTIEEVAQKAGVDPKALVETIRKYNEDVAATGKDSMFGRESLTSGYGKPLTFNQAPYYLYPSVPRCIATYCGLRIDPQARVIDVYGDPIPGLYACGEVTGGVHGAAYMTGTALGKAFSFGRIAAMQIAGK